MGHIDEKAFLDPQKALGSELFFQLRQGSVAGVFFDGFSGLHMDHNLAKLGLDIENGPQGNVDDLAVDLDLQGLADGPQLGDGLLKIIRQLVLHIELQHVAKSLHLIALWGIFDEVGDENDDGIPALCAEPPGDVQAVIAGMGKVDIQKGDVAAGQDRLANVFHAAVSMDLYADIHAPDRRFDGAAQFFQKDGIIIAENDPYGGAVSIDTARLGFLISLHDHIPRFPKFATIITQLAIFFNDPNSGKEILRFRKVSPILLNRRGSNAIITQKIRMREYEDSACGG